MVNNWQIEPRLDGLVHLSPRDAPAQQGPFCVARSTLTSVIPFGSPDGPGEGQGTGNPRTGNGLQRRAQATLGFSEAPAPDSASLGGECWGGLGWCFSLRRRPAAQFKRVLCSTLTCRVPWEVPLQGGLGFPRQAAHLPSLRLAWAPSVVVSNLAVWFGETIGGRGCHLVRLRWFWAHIL